MTSTTFVKLLPLLEDLQTVLRSKGCRVSHVSVTLDTVEEEGLVCGNARRTVQGEPLTIGPTSRRRSTNLFDIVIK
jgi:hypothetical protein